ncbi:MAG: hypothetical protein CMK09_19280 [Ponticaulis sp.]|nr:hypothetical protein [Ponticaulis sp.]
MLFNNQPVAIPSPHHKNPHRDELEEQIAEFMKRGGKIKTIAGNSETVPLPAHQAPVEFFTPPKGYMTFLQACRELSISGSTFRKRLKLRQLPERAKQCVVDGMPCPLWEEKEIALFKGKEPTTYLTMVDVADLANVKEWTVRAIVRANNFEYDLKMRVLMDRSVRYLGVFSLARANELIDMMADTKKGCEL